MRLSRVYKFPAAHDTKLKHRGSCVKTDLLIHTVQRTLCVCLYVCLSVYGYLCFSLYMYICVCLSLCVKTHLFTRCREYFVFICVSLYLYLCPCVWYIKMSFYYWYFLENYSVSVFMCVIILVFTVSTTRWCYSINTELLQVCLSS